MGQESTLLEQIMKVENVQAASSAYTAALDTRAAAERPYGLFVDIVRKITDPSAIALGEDAPVIRQGDKAVEQLRSDAEVMFKQMQALNVKVDQAKQGIVEAVTAELKNHPGSEGQAAELTDAVGEMAFSAHNNNAAQIINFSQQRTAGALMGVLNDIIGTSLDGALANESPRAVGLGQHR